MCVCNSHMRLLAHTDAHSVPHFSSQSATSRLTLTRLISVKNSVAEALLLINYGKSFERLFRGIPILINTLIDTTKINSLKKKKEEEE